MKFHKANLGKELHCIIIQGENEMGELRFVQFKQTSFEIKREGFLQCGKNTTSIIDPKIVIPLRYTVWNKKSYFLLLCFDFKNFSRLYKLANEIFTFIFWGLRMSGTVEQLNYSLSVGGIAVGFKHNCCDGLKVPPSSVSRQRY